MGVYTKQYNEIVDSIVSECVVYPAVDASEAEGVKGVKTDNAVWDTGATQTLISPKIAKELGLKVVAQCEVDSFDGVSKTNLYDVHIGLPTGDAILNVEAMETTGEAYDVVIGMDVICYGDFAFTNKDGKSTFSFRLPSQEEITFK